MLVLGTGHVGCHPASDAACRCGEPGHLSACAASAFQELDVWTTDFVLPATVWLAGFFNPQSFLTAIMQSMARKNEWPLDKMCLTVDVTKKYREEITAPPREGSFVHGLFMEGKNSSFYETLQMENAQPWEFLQAQLNLYSSCESWGQRGRCWGGIHRYCQATPAEGSTAASQTASQTRACLLAIGPAQF